LAETVTEGLGATKQVFIQTTATSWPRFCNDLWEMSIQGYISSEIHTTDNMRFCR
jgi:hypothetical protein